jgi:hypothetical protein
MQVGHRAIEVRLADVIERIAVFRRDLSSERIEILLLLFRRQRRERTCGACKAGSDKKKAAQLPDEGTCSSGNL